jgi:hypothetical protein
VPLKEDFAEGLVLFYSVLSLLPVKEVELLEADGAMQALRREQVDGAITELQDIRQLVELI